MTVIQPTPDFATEPTLAAILAELGQKVEAGDLVGLATDAKLEAVRTLLAGTLAVETGDDRVVVRAVECNVGSATSTGQPLNSATQLFVGPPPGKAWRVRAIRSIYTCDATVKDRVLVASFTSMALGDVWSMSAGTVAQASNIVELSGDDGGSPGQVNNGPTNGGENLLQVVNFGWPSMWIPPDVSLRLWMFTGNGVGDTFSDANALIEERDL